MTAIEWTDAVWNPIVGCSIVSPGCTHCYAMRMAARIEAIDDAAYWTRVRTALVGVEDADAENRIRAEINNARVRSHYAGTTDKSKAGAVWTGKVALAPDHIITAPLRWRTPRMVFVNSMGDLFHEDVPDEWIARVFYVMAQCHNHIFQILTKRAANMRRVMSDPAFIDDVRSTLLIIDNPEQPAFEWPLPNVWLGVSAERQHEADARIPDLLATPAAVRFVSAEPLLGEIDFARIGDLRGPHDALGADLVTSYDTTLDWIIVGGESGPGARPMHPDWARSIRDQCQAADVPFFFKQWGEWLPVRVDRHGGDDGGPCLWPDDSVDPSDAVKPFALIETRSSEWDGQTRHVKHARVGKSRAGRMLDGREWNGMPGQVETDPSARRPSRPAPRRGVARANQE